MLRRSAAAIVLTGAFSLACYVYTPVESVAPGSNIEVALSLTDVGRVEAGHALGPSVDRVEGRVESMSDTAYVLRVTSVRDIRGVVTKWSGEAVTVPMSWVGNAYQRRFSKGRTYVLAGVLAAGAAAFIATRTLGVAGPTFQGSGGGGGGGNNQ